jgi:Ca2+-binding EF-hand superfamily protein
MDLKAEAIEYLETHRVRELFSELGALLAFHRPENPNAFLVNFLRAEKTEFFNDSDFRVMFGLLDPTRKGVISKEQYTTVLKSISSGMREPVALKTFTASTIDCDSFVSLITADMR